MTTDWAQVNTTKTEGQAPYVDSGPRTWRSGGQNWPPGLRGSAAPAGAPLLW